jgi:subtilisin family serine protease
MITAPLTSRRQTHASKVGVRPMLRPLALCCGFIILWVITASAAPPQSQSETEYRTDQILVVPAPGVQSNTLAEFHARQHTRALGILREAEGLQVVAVPPTDTVGSLLAKYRRSSLVKFAEPDYIRHLDLTTPNDPLFLDGSLWGLNNYGQSSGTAHADIDAPRAWDVLTSASNVVVAVLDTGIRYTHEDLAPNLWVNPDDGAHGTNSIAGNSDATDDEGHGTLMAGVIGAVGNNGKGVAGVAWRIQLMACKCFTSSGSSSDSAIVAAIDYARLHGANIINASFDSPNLGLALYSAVVRAQLARILFVASSGNNSANLDITPHYPACFNIDNIVSVAYTTRVDGLGRFSNFGSTNVALAAPGADIYSTFFTSDAAYLGGPSLEGTSYAAAYVSGALALILAKYPGEPHQQTIVRLLNGTDPVPALTGKCRTGGRLNLYQALVPPIRLSALSALVPDLQRFRVNSSPLRRCVVQSSSDLISWSSVLTNLTAVTGAFEFTAAPASSSAARFYRAIDLP